MPRECRSIDECIDTLYNLINSSRIGVLRNICDRYELHRVLATARASVNLYIASLLYSKVYLCLDNLKEYTRRRNAAKRIVGIAKKHILEELIKKSTMCSDVLSFLDSYTRSIVDALRKSGLPYKLVIFTAVTTSRAFVGEASTGIYNVFEHGIALHPIYGVPYIPGSAIKGSLRSFVEAKGLPKECTIESLSDISDLFGSTRKVGDIIVFDAYPVRVASSGSLSSLLEPDVTTPIYADGTSSPKIEEHRAEPVPVIYPVIARGVVFRIIIALHRDISDECRYTLFNWIKSILSYGIGGKSRLGYGLLQVWDEL